MKQLDVVQITRSDRVKYLSAPKNNVANPNWYWSVVGFINNDALISRQGTLVRIPTNDVRMIGSYSIDVLFECLKGNDNKIDVLVYLSRAYNKPSHQILNTIKKFNLPLFVNDKLMLDKIDNKYKNLIEEYGE